MRQSISKYTNIIQNRLFPELKSKLGIDMYTEPTHISSTTALYNGNIDTEQDNKTIGLYFYSNHVALQSYDSKDPVVFIRISYAGTVEDGGILDLSNINDCVDIIYVDIYEEGFRTSDDMKEDAKKAEEERQQVELEKQKKEKEAEERRKANIADELEKEKQQELEDKQTAHNNRIAANREVRQSIKDFDKLFDKNLDYLISRNEIGDKMEIVFTFTRKNKENEVSFVYLDATYISSNMCLAQADKFNPKVDTTTTWDKIKQYCKTVASKIKSTLGIILYDKDGEILELPEDEDNSNNIDIGINI